MNFGILELCCPFCLFALLYFNVGLIHFKSSYCINFLVSCFSAYVNIGLKIYKIIKNQLLSGCYLETSLGGVTMYKVLVVGLDSCPLALEQLGGGIFKPGPRRHKGHVLKCLDSPFFYVDWLFLI